MSAWDDVIAEDIAGMKDWVETSAVSDTLSLTNIHEERSSGQLEVQNWRLGASGTGIHIWGLLAPGGTYCSCGNQEKNLKMIRIKVVGVILGVVFIITIFNGSKKELSGREKGKGAKSIHRRNRQAENKV